MSTSFISQLRTYNQGLLKSDAIAGLTVAVMLVPQGMAYALLSGVPPIYGLYAGLIPLLIYPFFGTSRHLSVGPVALVSILVLTGLTEFAEPFSEEYISLAILTSLVAGLIQVILSLFKMGFLVNFLSHPVINGFTSAAALIIGVSQLKYFFGIAVPRSGSIVSTVKDLFTHLNDVHLITLLIGAGGLALILILKRVNKSIPGSLIVVILSIFLVFIFGWHKDGVAIVEEVPKGLPGFYLPALTIENIVNVFPLALIICLISFIESLAIAKTLAAKHDNYPIKANKELLGLGMAKIIGSFFQGIPNTGSFTRSAINEQAGAKTGVSSLFAAIIIALTLLFFTPLFYYLPQAILATIVISAVFGLIDIKGAKKLFYHDRNDFYVLITTFILTLFLGIREGVLTGIILSLVMIIIKVSKPHFAILGNLPNTPFYRNVDRYEEAITDPRYLVFRYDADIFFGNAEHFYETALEKVSKHPELKVFMLDASSIGHIDSTGIHQLKLLKESLDKQNIQFIITSLRGPVRDIFRTNNLYQLISKENIYLHIDHAVNAFNNQTENILQADKKEYK
jgi:SulP family sulfate permease